MNVSWSFTHSEIAGGRRLGFSHVMGFTPVLLGFPKPLGSRKMMDCFSASWCSDLCSSGECQASAIVCDRWRYCFSYIIKDTFCLFFGFLVCFGQWSWTCSFFPLCNSLHFPVLWWKICEECLSVDDPFSPPLWKSVPGSGKFTF